MPKISHAVVCFMMWTGVAAAQQTEAEHELQRRIAVGQTLRIRGHVNYHRCGTVIPTEIVVFQQPTHGHLEVRDQVVKSTEPELGHGSKCAGYSGLGKVVYYTRTSEGADELKYDSRSENGVVHIHVLVE